MNNQREDVFFDPKITLKFVKVIVLLLAIGFSQLLAANKTQAESITISVKGERLVNVLKEIEKQSNFLFFYNLESVDTNKKVSLEKKGCTIKEILDDIAVETGLVYTIKDRHVVLSSPSANNENILETTQRQKKRRIAGIVKDVSGDPVIGASVMDKSTGVGAITDIDGNFSLEVSDQSILQVSFIGYVAQELAIKKQTSVSITLKEDMQALDEVVVVGYGTQKKVNLTGSITTANSDFLENRPLTTSSQALQGLQGVYLNQMGGQPGVDNVLMRIRGVGTLNNNNPLVLIDGIAGSLSSLNPNDIENISVLKDAASAAVYGSRAANGVVLITTKSGQKGEKFTVDYNNYIGVQKVTYLPDAVWDSYTYLKYRDVCETNQGKAPIYGESLLNEYKAGMASDSYKYPSTNWFDLTFRDALIHEHNARVSGGGDKYAFSASLGYLYQDGVMLATNSKKYTMSMNSSVEVSNRLKLSFNLLGTFNDYNEPHMGASSYMMYVLRSLPVQLDRLRDGRYGRSEVTTPGQGTFYNLLGHAQEGTNNHKQQTILANVNAEYTFPFDIRYKINFGVNKYDELNKIFTPIVVAYTPITEVSQNSTTERQGRNIDKVNLNTSLYQTLNWEKNFARVHKLSLLGGMSYEDFFVSEFSGQAQGYLDNTLTEINAGSKNKNASGTSSRVKLLSYFGRLNYTFNDKYLFEANFRYDGSSRFAKGSQWGLFPSLSAGWRIDQEGFMKELEQLSQLKLRASWGKLGNQEIGNYKYVSTINLNRDYSFGNTVSPGAAATTAVDPNISWESTRITNIGVDFGFWSNKLSGSLEWFNKKTTGILRPINIPAQVGNYGGPTTNIGTVENKGAELGLNYRDKIGEVTFSAGTSLSYVKNEVIDLKGQDIIDWEYITREGYPIRSYYLYEADGIFQSQAEIDASPFQSANTKPGDIKFKNQDGNNVIDDKDKIVVGSSVPNLTYSFNLSVGYKGFELSAFFQGVRGVDTYAQHNMAMPYNNGAGVTWDWINNSWTPENPSAKLPRLLAANSGHDNYNKASTFWLRDASYLRMKNVQLSYTVPKKCLQAVGIQKLSFFVNGQNLLTFSGFKLFDPEKDLNDTSLYSYPSVKMFTGGLNVTF